MNHQKREIINFIGTCIVVVLLMFIFSSSDKSHKETTKSSLHYELITAIKNNDIKAVLVQDTQLPSLQNITAYVPVNLFKENQQLLIDNYRLRQDIVFIKQQQNIIKPMRLARLFYHHFYITDDDLPVLS